MRSTRIRSYLPVLLTVAGCALFAPAAQASSVTVDGGVMTITTNPGEENDIEFAASGSDDRGPLVRVEDSGSSDQIPGTSTERIVAGGTCDQDSTGRHARCPTDGLTTVVVDLGAEDDQYHGRGMPVNTTLELGAGNDLGETERSASDVVRGSDGNDTLATVGTGSSSGAVDTFEAGAGIDVIDFGRSFGADSVSGGSGGDLATYASRSFTAGGSGGVTVTLDGVANDGQGTEGDNVRADVERVTGSSRNDNLNGNAGFNVLEGLGGVDRFNGGDGTDRILARDGNGETVLCGNGFDLAAVIDLEDGPKGCESVDRSPVDDGLPSHAAGKRLRIATDGGARVRIVCPNAARARCDGRVSVRDPRHPGRALASGAYDIRVGERETVSLQFAPAERNLLRNRGEALVKTREQGRSRKGPRSSKRILNVP
jgi:Ca2+-binding RTX toxin-like protein